MEGEREKDLSKGFTGRIRIFIFKGISNNKVSIRSWENDIFLVIIISRYI